MSYGTWLSGVVNNAKKKAEEAIGGAIQTGQNVVNDAVQTGQQVVQNTVNNAVNAGQQVVQNVASGYGDWVAQGQNVVNGAVQTGQQVATDYVNNTVIPIANQAVQAGQQAATDYYNNTVVPTVNQTVANAQEQATNYVNNTVVPTVNNAIGQGAQAVTDNVNNINGQVQAAVGNAPTEGTQPVATPTVQNPGTNAPITQEPSQSTTTESPGSEHIDSYEEFLNKQANDYGGIKDKTTAFYDQQNQEELKALDDLKAKGDATAKDIYDTTNKTLAEQKESIYNYADEQLNSSLGYNQEAYDKLVTSITQQMEAGKISAQEAKELLLIAAEEAKNLTYASAERQRQEAEKMADIQRQRAIADANSAYEQNKTGYGAKAEAMGNMGLTGGGYSDWLDSAAYAQNRAETQAARAQSDTTKREAKYSEDQKKLSADANYNEKKYAAESDYLNKIFDIDTSYRANMSEAEQTKLAADQKAKETAAGLKMDADTAEREGKLQAETTYKGYLYDNESEYQKNVLESNKTAGAGKLNAEISYVESIMNNDKALAEYKESLKAGTKEAEEKKLALYEQLIRGAGNGTYSADDAKALAEAFGFSEEWTNNVVNSANNYQSGISDTENKANAEVSSQRYASLLTGAANGTYNEATVKALAKEWGLSEDQTNELVKAAQDYSSKVSDAESKAKAEANVKNFAGFLDNARNGAYAGYTDKEIESLASELGITLNDSQKALIKASMGIAAGEAGEADDKYRLNVYSELLMGAKDGTYTADELKDFATRFGLDEGMTSKLMTAAGAYETNKGNAEANAATEQKRADFINILSDIKMGAFNSSEIDAIAKQFGFDSNDPADAEMIQMFKDAAQAYENGVEEMDENTKISIYSELLSGAKSGAYTEEEIADFAERFGLDEGMTSNLTTAVKDYNTKISDAEAEQNAANKTSNFVNMLNDVKNGAYTKDEIAEIASQLGFDENDPADKKLIDMLTKAADRYEAGVDEMDAATKTANFVDLLGMVNSGQLTKEEAAEIAKQLGFDETADKTSLDLLNTAADRYASGTEEDKKAAKTTNFIALLDGANSGAYNSEQIAEIAAQLGFDANDPEDKKLIDMLSKAADGFASEEAAAELKADKQYMNGLYAELLSAANNGDYDAEDIKDLASRFGFDEADQGKLAKAAEKYAKNKAAEELELKKGASAENKLQIESTLTSDTTDEKIDEYVDAGYITEEDAEKLKVDRNNVAKQELSDMIKGGDYTGAVERAEELYDNGKGYLDKDTYQSAYFGAAANNCTQVKTVDDIMNVEADLKNQLAAGQISQKDYDNLVSYMYQNAGEVLDSGSYTVTNSQVKVLGMETYHPTVKIGDEEVKFNGVTNTRNPASQDVSPVLDKLAPNGGLIMFDGELYLKTETDKHWTILNDNKRVKALKEEYSKLYSRQPQIKAPKHEADPLPGANNTVGKTNTNIAGKDT